MSSKRRVTDSEKAGYILDKELITRFRREYDIPYDTAKRLVEAVFELAKHVLVTTGFMNIRGFGVFEVRTRKRCRYHNRYTGTVDEMALLKVAKFLPARSLKDSINMKTSEELIRYLKKQTAIKNELKHFAMSRLD